MMPFAPFSWIVNASRSRHDGNQMLWQGRRESENVEDVRGSGGGRRLAVGGGIGGIIFVVLYLLLGGNPQALFDSQQQAQLSQAGQSYNQAPRADAWKFVAVVLDATAGAWLRLC